MPDIAFHDRPRFPRGFRCASRLIGLKSDGKDLALFVSDVDAAAAAVFTRNHFPGAPVILGRETIRGGRLRAVVVNSKVSNVATGEGGIADARRMASAAAAEVGSTARQVLVSSTGVIGVRLPIEKIERGNGIVFLDTTVTPFAFYVYTVDAFDLAGDHSARSRGAVAFPWAPPTFVQGGASATIQFAVGQCSLGAILVAATDKGICAITLDDDPGALVRDLQDRLLREGYRVRIYVPYGTEWYPYLMRRLAERPANLLFIVRSLIRERRAA